MRYFSYDSLSLSLPIINALQLNESMYRDTKKNYTVEVVGRGQAAAAADLDFFQAQLSCCSTRRLSFRMQICLSLAWPLLLPLTVIYCILGCSTTLPSTARWVKIKLFVFGWQSNKKKGQLQTATRQHVRVVCRCDFLTAMLCAVGKSEKRLWWWWWRDERKRRREDGEVWPELSTNRWNNVQFIQFDWMESKKKQLTQVPSVLLNFSLRCISFNFLYIFHFHK